MSPRRPGPRHAPAPCHARAAGAAAAGRGCVGLRRRERHRAEVTPRSEHRLHRRRQKAGRCGNYRACPLRRSSSVRLALPSGAAAAAAASASVTPRPAWTAPVDRSWAACARVRPAGAARPRSAIVFARVHTGPGIAALNEGPAAITSAATPRLGGTGHAGVEGCGAARRHDLEMSTCPQHLAVCGSPVRWGMSCRANLDAPYAS